ncbi:MAG: PD-(D/E)XK nuclease family protein [Asgard group archaeon]|nr:PD-(D/E)XK nuclease family protein [Asgard group archaeon]
MILKNEFSWSVSRDSIFKKCHRMYYYHYYGSWGGWDTEADERTRMIYVLKQLQNRQMWAGTKVHECIKRTLENIQAGIEVKEELTIEETLSIMRQEFKSSQSKIYLLNPKACALFEHEYEIPVSNAEWKNNADHVVACLKTFFSSNVYQEILRLSANQWLEIEQFSSFLYKNIKIFSVFDFAYQRDDTFLILDWKTGKEEADRKKLQLACYGLFAKYKWGARPENIKLKEFFLSNGKLNEYVLEEFNLDDIHNYISKSIKAMQNPLDNPEENIANEDNFPFSDVDSTCSFCNFLKICTRKNNDYFYRTGT